MFRIFLFSATAPTEIYTLSLHDALPISQESVHRRTGQPAVAIHQGQHCRLPVGDRRAATRKNRRAASWEVRSEEHTSELQSHSDLVCRLLLEKKKHARSASTGYGNKNG